jgi:hypothetical protein
LMMPVECGAESMTIKQQVTARVLARCPSRTACRVICKASRMRVCTRRSSVLQATSLVVSRSVTRERKERREHRRLLWFGASMPDTDCHQRDAVPMLTDPAPRVNFARRSLRCFVSTLSSK